jgi:uncharacterized membrane protein YfcA
MELLTVIILLAGGAVAGFLAGLSGIGGGVIAVPLLLFALRSSGVSTLVSTHVALGTSLLAVSAASWFRTAAQRDREQVLWTWVLRLGGAGGIGAVAGSALAATLHPQTLQRTYAVVALISAVRLAVGQKRTKGDKKTLLGLPGVMVIGAVSGSAGALTGTGTEIVGGPVLYSGLRLPLMRARATASASSALAAALGAAGYAAFGAGSDFLPAGSLGYVSWLQGIILAAGFVAGAVPGSRMMDSPVRGKLEKLFALILLTIGVRLLFG